MYKRLFRLLYFYLFFNLHHSIKNHFSVKKTQIIIVGYWILGIVHMTIMLKLGACLLISHCSQFRYIVEIDFFCKTFNEDSIQFSVDCSIYLPTNTWIFTFKVTTGCYYVMWYSFLCGNAIHELFQVWWFLAEFDIRHYRRIAGYRICCSTSLHECEQGVNMKYAK